MRSITFTVTRTGGFHPTTDGLPATGSAPTRKWILHFNVLDDGTLVGLFRAHFDAERMRRSIEENSSVIDYSVSNEGDDTILVYLHRHLPGPIKEIIRPLDEHEVFFESFEYVRENVIRVTMIGETNEALQEALEAIPEEIDRTIERIGAYTPERNDLSGVLTDRQQEVLEVAMELGYYENPRRTTNEAIAKRMEIDASTVNEHLRKIESRTFASFTR